jgi:hypothetical protein
LGRQASRGQGRTGTGLVASLLAGNKSLADDFVERDVPKSERLARRSERFPSEPVVDPPLTFSFCGQDSSSSQGLGRQGRKGHGCTDAQAQGSSQVCYLARSRLQRTLGNVSCRRVRGLLAAWTAFQQACSGQVQLLTFVEEISEVLPSAMTELH